MTTCAEVVRLTSLAIALVGCADELAVSALPETPPVENVRAMVLGHVVDADGAPLAGATITVRASGEHATADASGAFVLDVPADTTLTLAATAPNMATTLIPQFMVSPDASASLTIPLVTADRIASLAALGPNAKGGAVAIAVRSLSGAARPAGVATIEMTPSSLGAVLYAPALAGMPDPDPSLTTLGSSGDYIAWAVGVQPHVSIMTFALRGMEQVQPPFAIDDVIWPGTFTVDAGALTLVTLFTP